jgi:exonuclease VII large subunit
MKFWERRTSGPIQAIHPSTNKVIEVDPQRDAKISSDLDKELRRLPALLSWYMALRDHAGARLREAMHDEHNAEEDLYGELREKNPKATETTIKMAVKKQPRMRKAYRDRMDAETMHQRLKSAVEAIAEKRWSLMGLTKTALMERGTKDSM